MRKAINDNPMVQVGLLAVLALVVGFVLLTQMGKGSSSSNSSSSSPTSSSSASVAGDASTPSTDSSATTAAPSDSSAATPSTGAPAPATGQFVAGPGLPAPVVNAYKANKVVVLLVVRRGGIDDDAVKAATERMSGLPEMALFVTNAGHVSRYSRIATGVDLDRVPALIVLRPSGLTKGPMPEATVSYGFRGPDSIAQAVNDALYAGRTDLPYYPK
jgi:hypothetical protein